VSSSTSSSRRYQNIWAAMVIAFAFLVTYEVFLRVAHPAPGPGTSQGQANTVRLEALAFGPKDPSVLLAGSSLTFNLKPELVDSRALNVGLGANSVATPLEVALAAKLRPKVVLVEVGLPLLKGVNHQAVTDIDGPVSHVLLGGLKMLRQGYQPVNLALSKVVGKRKTEKTVDAAVMNLAIDLKLKEGQIPLSVDEKQKLREVFEVIRRAIHFWEPRGSQVIFHEIPGEPRVMATPRYLEVMQLTLEQFPPTRNRWVRRVGRTNWRTSDGVHLVSDDVDRYCRYLHDFLRSKLQ
jgi:hypothetical protein